ncbi:hypothetical protein SeMB42_g06081 [Synchytrium endobioticum]|uniref:Uncharacterized protein n=1 Tax=Synchytrium endobioticum TaxID=286115 RepID=A0A507CS91_9FUNG|nr:hypothetical protein SeMB42_g06081 [Synchytrium endobioticum]TPX41931.1 hypothetical protein SeLEV6574_g05845 [Synchytrium endobioticum]
MRQDDKEDGEISGPANDRGRRSEKRPRSRSRSQSRPRPRPRPRDAPSSSSSSRSSPSPSTSRKHKKSSRKPSPSTASSRSSSSSASDSEPRSKKDKKKSHKKHKKSSSSSKHKSKKKKHKKSKAHSKWGLRGVITPQDRIRKDPEFRSWLMECKNISIEVLNPQATKDYFAEYAEDYNLGLLPHEKYYDLDAFEKSDRAQRLLLGDSAHDEYDFRKDEENLKRTSKSTGPSSSTTILSKDQIEELQRVQRERLEADRLRKLGYDVSKKNLGVRYEATMQ